MMMHMVVLLVRQNDFGSENGKRLVKLEHRGRERLL